MRWTLRLIKDILIFTIWVATSFILLLGLFIADMLDCGLIKQLKLCWGLLENHDNYSSSNFNNLFLCCM